MTTLDQALDLLDRGLPYLTTLQNLCRSRVAPCMGLKDDEELTKLIDEIWDLLKEAGYGKITDS